MIKFFFLKKHNSFTQSCLRCKEQKPFTNFLLQDLLTIYYVKFMLKRSADNWLCKKFEDKSIKSIKCIEELRRETVKKSSLSFMSSMALLEFNSRSKCRLLCCFEFFKINWKSKQKKTCRIATIKDTNSQLQSGMIASISQRHSRDRSQRCGLLVQVTCKEKVS